MSTQINIKLNLNLNHSTSKSSKKTQHNLTNSDENLEKLKSLGSEFEDLEKVVKSLERESKKTPDCEISSDASLPLLEH